MEIFCFFAGILFVFSRSFYALVLFGVLLYFRPQRTLVIGFLLALGWGSAHQIWVDDRGMPQMPVVKHALLEGAIASIPVVSATRTQFQFNLTQIDGKAAKAKLTLSCYEHCPEVHAGERWQLQAKLRRPVNLRNPGGFDYVNYLEIRHIHWMGTVLKGTMHRLGLAKPYSLLALRERLAHRQAAFHLDEKTLGIWQALTLGVTSHVEQSDWELFRKTGTVHLMVISGAHIGLITGFIVKCVKWGWSSFRWLSLHYPAPKVASGAGIVVATLYTILAGFGVPAERAWIVLLFMLGRQFLNQRFSSWQAWRYALLGVLVSEPHSVLMPGFYLSFLAVAVLILSNQRFSYRGLKREFLTQAACLLGLMPVTLFFFSYGATNGFIANLIAIPWMGFVVTPLCALSALGIGWLPVDKMVWALSQAIHGLLVYLQWVELFSVLNFDFSFTQVLAPIGLTLVMGLAVFLPAQRLWFAMVILVGASLTQRVEKIASGEVRVDVLDVGQGLAVVARTAHHTLIYDTGVKFPHGGDMAQRAIIPYLRRMGVLQLDKVVISHPDLDHRGGLESLEANYSIGELIVDNPSFYSRGQSCHAYPDWDWDGVLFQFFAIKVPLKGKNNQSCVLKISTDAGQMLLTGDIEKQAENYLVHAYGHELRSTVMLVPHHGSRSSSSNRFVDRVSPRYAIVSSGFDNRYRLPHPSVQTNYQKRNVRFYNTADSGMVRIQLKAAGITTLTTYQ